LETINRDPVKSGLKPSICTGFCPKLHRGDFFGAAIRVGGTDLREIYGAWCLGRIVVPLIPVFGFAGPPTLDEPTPDRAKFVPLIVPRLTTAGLTI